LPPWPGSSGAYDQVNRQNKNGAACPQRRGCQLLRKALAVPDARGKPDDFIDLEGVMSWIKSLSASVSNGLRNILKFGAADFGASL
jgi:hypothetical protein